MPGDVVPLSYTEWRLVELGGEAVELHTGEGEPHLLLDLEESRVVGFGGVNRLTGTFSLAEGELRFGTIATTLLAGPEAALERERALLDALAQVTSYTLEGRSLAFLADDVVVARFVC